MPITYRKSKLSPLPGNTTGLVKFKDWIYTKDQNAINWFNDYKTRSDAIRNYEISQGKVQEFTTVDDVGFYLVNEDMNLPDNPELNYFTSDELNVINHYWTIFLIETQQEDLFKRWEGQESDEPSDFTVVATGKN